MSPDWPTVDLDPITQLRAVHAGLPGTALEERVLDVAYDAFWARVDDIETFVPTIDPLVRHMKVTARVGDSIECRSDLFRLEGELRSGFMWMQSRRGAGRLFVVGTAAVATQDGRTRVAHLEGLRLPGARVLRPWFRRTVRWDLNGMERLTRSF
ncbi:MAG TPA: hypothetical protein VFB78_17555 [Acidimicrobiales bacterium]|nr:hypothetical protein [Acidimicrobiales bacterium]